jgi:predicted Zn-dependent protease
MIHDRGKVDTLVFYTPLVYPESLFEYEPDTSDTKRYLASEDVDTLFERVLALTAGGGDTTISVESQWTGNLRWARNAVTTSGDTRDNVVTITRTIRGASAVAQTNQLDDESLRVAIESAERILRYRYEDPDATLLLKQQTYAAPTIWGQTTYDLTAQPRSTAARALVASVVKAGLRSAGYIQVDVLARAVRNTRGLSAYYKRTAAQYSVTVRDTKGTSSGWAGESQCDWQTIDAAAITACAIHKCVTSSNPRAVEPGRYTAVLESQAVYDFLYPAVQMLDRRSAEGGRSPYMLRPGQSKIGLRIFDERITIRSDPMDPDGGYLPFTESGEPYHATTWVDHGVLKVLSYDREYAHEQLGVSLPCPNPLAFRVDDGSTSLDDMITSTERGLLVTRLSGVLILDPVSLLTTAVTRDGLWLIEQGKITHPVKNFRISDSPMFVFNNVAQIGKAVRVFSPKPAVVPPMKVRDFNCAGLADAI